MPSRHLTAADRRYAARMAPPLAAAFLAGAWNERRLVARGAQALEPRPRWLRPVARAVLGYYHEPPADRPRELASVLERLVMASRRPGEPLPRIRRWFLFEQEMAWHMRWPVPPIATSGALARFLALEPGEFEWLADPRYLEQRAEHEPLRNYRYAWIPRGTGHRVIERPKRRLKAAQRRVLHEILDWIPAHPAAYGFVPGRSARGGAEVHLRRPVVLRFDLEDFFASVEARRVYGIFRTSGYPESVAHKLTSLSTNVIPVEVWEAVPRPVEPAAIPPHHRLGRRLATPHLPQGAPTSPALANLCAFGLDRRLAGLAASIGAAYTRYADDLVISGEAWLARRGDQIAAAVAAIARDEGFRLNERKTRVMPRSGRQHVCGVVVNERPNVPRREYDRLKAILHNAAVRGPAGENRSGVPDFRAHLLGRISWVESLNPERGRKLRRRFAAIDWGG